MTSLIDNPPDASKTAQAEGGATAANESKVPRPLVVTDEQKEGRELVLDAYVGVAEVVFNWSKQVDEIQVCQLAAQQRLCSARELTLKGNAVRAMTNMTGLTHPDHPLHREGEDGITVYMGELIQLFPAGEGLPV
jgi:hypothetical protein